MQLRDYQKELITHVSAALKEHKHVLLQSPTGAGKTAMAAYMIKTAMEKGRSVVFQVHRRELVEQVSNTFKDLDIPHSFIASEYEYDAGALCHIALVNTLVNRMERILAPDLFIIDECHMSASKTWSKAVAWAKEAEAYVVGLTATPWRFDGKGLGCHFNYMVESSQIRWFIEQGYLSNYKYYAPTNLDTSGWKIKHGDFDIHQVEDAMMNPKLVGDAVVNWERYALNKRTIIFAPTVKVSKEVVMAFNSAGHPAIHLDSKMNRIAREGAITGFADGKYQILSNVSMMVEGFDLASYAKKEVPIEACILFTSTASLSRYLQMVGRALRPKQGDAIFIDHGSNHKRHNLPIMERTWSLDDMPRNKKKEKSAEAEDGTQCPSCFAVHEPAPECPECGHVYEKKERKVVRVEGELEEITESAFRKNLEREERAARAAFRKTALERGYKPGWVFYEMQRWREKRKSTRRITND